MSMKNLKKAAAGGGILANQILGAAHVLPTLGRMVDTIRGRMDRQRAGKTFHNTEAQFAQIMADKLGRCVSIVEYNHPDAGYYATNRAIAAYQAKGLPGVIEVIESVIKDAEGLASLTD